jgi:mRNA interferase RelE/StbE
VNYSLLIAESAEKTLSKLPKRDKEKIVEKIEALGTDPRPIGYTKLKGSTKNVLYRIRHGDYRIIYTVKDEKLLVLVVEIGNRREIYR